MEEDDMLFTYSKEDGMNQVPRPVKRRKTVDKTPVPGPEPLRKSKRPPRPKQLDSESDEEIIPRPKIGKDEVKRGRGRPKGSTKKNKQQSSDLQTVQLKSGSSTELVTLKRQPGGQTYIVESPATPTLSTQSSNIQRVLSLTPSDNSDVDIEGAETRKSRHNSGC